MTNRDQFIDLVKFYLALDRAADEVGTDRAVGIAVRAMAVPDWAPRIEDVREEGGWAALVKNFVWWNYERSGFDTPPWFYRCAPSGV